MMNNKLAVILVLLFAVLMSLPWLVPHMGWVALFAFVPLLCLDRLADFARPKRFFLWYFAAFLLWNAATTFWVCNATVGGGIAAMVVNASIMSVIWLLFRLSKKKFSGIVPYIFLAVLWIAWERTFFNTQISWPWLTLGNAFARTTTLVQWYEVTGVLGGSLWIWGVNLGLFALMVNLSNGNFASWNLRCRIALPLLLGLFILVPAVGSELRYSTYTEDNCGTVNVVVGQTNFDPYQKYTSVTQTRQNAALLEQFAKGMENNSSASTLLIAPESFTADVCINDVNSGPSVQTFLSFLENYPGSEMLIGASTYEMFYRNSAPSPLARSFGPGRWYETHNSALLLSNTREPQIYHKSKLVVGTELMPFPRILAPIDDALGGVLARCVPQKEISVMHLQDNTPFGCAICYESVYGDFCTGYARKGAQFLAVITNDGWWGDTPGYRQHFSYSRLRAIELRRDIARSANTGISAIINQRGDVVEETGWWVPDYISSSVNCSQKITPFARWGDVTGRVCSLAALLLLALLLCRFLIRKG
ncbi:MAG: apolipoprotein N-acyltransferase [Bacteroidales bacterium]|nr:apolipoprotein N-acyltransferase [Candidatus Cryptobacteroides fimicaballi]